MFKFLKEKLKGVLRKISKKVEEEAPEEVKQVITEKKIKKKEKKLKRLKEKKEVKEIKEEPKVVEEKGLEIKEEERPKEKKKGFFAKLFFNKEKKEVKEEKIEEIKAEEKKEVETSKINEEETKVEEAEEQPEEKRGFFSRIKERIVTKRISSDKFEELFSDLEIILLENNVALEVVDKIKNDLKEKLVDKPIKRGAVLDTIRLNLKSSIEDLFKFESIDIIKEIKNKKEKPYVILFVGVNGGGKTTTIAKVANMLKEHKLSCLLVAGDTWRAAAIQQLEEHGKKLGIRVIKHDYQSDPAAVAFDGIKAAKANNADVVLIDTAGRQHSNVNLMNEMEKIVRVAKPDLKIFIGESIAGNDCINQAVEFNKYVDFNGIILTKTDVDEKGGAAISVGYVTGKPIIYVGTGQGYDNLKKFDPGLIIRGLGLE